MKLIGAGMPRTGTFSQKLSLEMFGLGPCYHMVDVLARPGRARMWERALAGEPDWTQIFAGFQSTVGWPGGYFYRELAAFYPEAKVLLTVRDPESWERSMRQTVWAVRNGESLPRLLASAQAHVDPQWAGLLRMIDALLWHDQGTFAAGHETPEQCMEAFERHNEEVRRVIAPERLLVWSVADGWEPLCDFLEVPVPGAPIPHINDRTEFLNRVIDGSLDALSHWRAEQARVVAASALGGQPAG